MDKFKEPFHLFGYSFNEQVIHRLNHIIKQNDHLIEQGEILMALIDDLQQDVLLLVTLADQVLAKLANAGTDPTKLQAIKDAVDAVITKFQAAVA